MANPGWESLPSHLSERLRWESPPKNAVPQGRFILYWMHNALRGHENPALDVAICWARSLDLPLLVYQGLCEEYPYASDRHHAFILQGARDVQQELTERGIRYAFHLQRRGSRGPYLKQLAEQAAVVVTEEMPVEPLVGWLERMRTTLTVPIACIDTACIVPMPMLGKAYERAFQFRDATKTIREARLLQPWHEQAVDCSIYDGELPFESLDLATLDLAELIGQCEIDHLVAPVADTAGGTIAGYERWTAYKRHGLSSYAKSRTNAANPQAGSRMSAYLHYGMVSPFRLAREAAERDAEKFLDELLIWRELAFHFCFHGRHDLDSLDSLPKWAQKTLAEHQDDPRCQDYSWEQLARGQSEDPLWNACQRSLLKHGELHNNVRMTWGKALLPWVKSPQRALQMLIDLNHRYALDGRDPCSYGGLLWCLGLFDRPAPTTTPVYGQVPPRPLADHARRLDTQQYFRHVDRCVTEPAPRIAIVGAGIGGLIAARALTDHGLDVTLFDKSRGVGGRIATRRAPSGVYFDHGAQYFTVRDHRFAKYVCSWYGAGIIAPWHGRIVEIRDGQIVAEKGDTPRYVAVPAMNSLARHLATDLNVVRETRITQMQRTSNGWLLHHDQGPIEKPFDYVLINCPPQQAAAILPTDCDLRKQLLNVTMDPCWTVMLEFEERLPIDFDGAFVHNSPLGWIARDSSKPGRPEGCAWILHATGEWSWEHLEEDQDEVLAELLDHFSEITGVHISEAVTMAAHRWRYAKPRQPLTVPCLWKPELSLGVCGDWCDGPRIEGAFLSGAALAGSLLRQLTIRTEESQPYSALLF